MKKVVSTVFTVFLALVIGLLVIRVIISSDKSMFDRFDATALSAKSYRDSEKLNIYTIQNKEKISQSGYFSAFNFYAVEDTEEFQVGVRYNKSALRYTDIDSDDKIGFALQIEYPSEEGEDSRFVYHIPVKVEYGEKYWGLYKFRKLYFEDVDLYPEDVEIDDIEFSVIMYFIDENTEAPEGAFDKFPYTILDRQVMHYKGQPVSVYNLGGKDTEALKNYN